MSKPISGQPLIVSAKTTASADSALAVLSPRSNRTAGELALQCFRARVPAIDVIVDPFRKRVVATEDADFRDAVLGSMSFSDYAVVAPDTNGLLSHWSIVENFSSLDIVDYFHATNRRSVVQVIDHYSRDDLQTFIFASQTYNVLLISTGGESPTAENISDAIDAAARTGFTVTYELTPKPGYTPQTFE